MTTRRVAVARCAGATALAMLAASAATPSQASDRDTGVRDASGGDGRAQTEQTLAVNPRNPGNVLIGYINGVSVSYDGGRAWRRVTSLSCSGDGNPSFDAGGTAYFECGGSGVQIQVYASADGGDHWTGPVTAASDTDNNGDFIDRPWLVGSAARSGDRLG